MLIMNLLQILEEQLDDITTGKEEWLKVLDNFWKDFHQNVFKCKRKKDEGSIRFT